MNDEQQPVRSVDQAERERLAAGEFSSWLELTRRALRSRSLDVNVPCGGCTACCRSSMFIHIGPEETQTLKRIPKALLFAAPGFPKGHVVMGYNPKGECPMLIDGACSIYEHRPQTCRAYDCRVLAATATEPTDGSMVEIAERVRRWEFETLTEQTNSEHRAVLAAASFLREQAKRFPAGALPSHPFQLAVVAIKVYQIFAKSDRGTGEGARGRADTEIVEEILQAIEKFEARDSGAEASGSNA